MLFRSGEQPPQLRDLLEALQRGAQDDRVVGLIAHVGAESLGMGARQEIRDAVRAFAATGKKTIAFAESFGEFAPGGGAYYLATAFDKIYLQPSGDVGLSGLIVESPFVRGTLDKLDIEPRLDQRKEYKNAMNLFTEKAYTPAHREALEAVMISFRDQIVQGIAQGRGLPEARAREIFAGGPYVAQEALAIKLVDALVYRDEAYALARKALGEDAQTLLYGQYLERAGRPHMEGPTIALIYGVGQVVRGESNTSPVSGSSTMGSQTVAGAFRQAVDDENVKAIVFRIDSPGGSYIASDTIWRETVRAREAGKPVIATMGSVAGSGGYFVAMAADKIVAQPGTITGSIGVLAGKMLTRKFWENLGITWDDIRFGENANIWTGTYDYDDRGWQRFQLFLDRIYEDFTNKVAEGRKLPKERVLEIAKGRIWSGADAKALGLVDALGGFPEALALAREAAGLEKDAAVTLKLFPEPRSAIEQLLDEGPESLERAAVGRAMGELRASLGPAIDILEQVGALSPNMQVLRMPPGIPRF